MDFNIDIYFSIHLAINIMLTYLICAQIAKIPYILCTYKLIS